MTSTAQILSKPAERMTVAENRHSPALLRTHCLTLTNKNIYAIGSLLRYTATGVDVATCDPLPADAVVAVDGTIHAGDQWMHLSGMARVESCEPTEFDVHRVRLNLKGARWTSVPDPNSPEGRVVAKVS